MNHVAFDVPEDYHRRLLDKGLEVTAIANHDDSARTFSDELHPECSCELQQEPVGVEEVHAASALDR